MRSRTRDGDGGISVVFFEIAALELKTASESGLAESNGGIFVAVGFVGIVWLDGATSPVACTVLLWVRLIRFNELHFTCLLWTVQGALPLTEMPFGRLALAYCRSRNLLWLDMVWTAHRPRPVHACAPHGAGICRRDNAGVGCGCACSEHCVRATHTQTSRPDMVPLYACPINIPYPLSPVDLS